MRTPFSPRYFWIAAVLSITLLASPRSAQGADKKERDIFDYAAQKAARDVKKIVFVADMAPHGDRGNHEFLAGAIFMAIHYGVEVNKGDQGEHYLKWLGGYFEPFWSVNPWWTPSFKELPRHEVTRGVKPFAIN